MRRVVPLQVQPLRQALGTGSEEWIRRPIPRMHQRQRHNMHGIHEPKTLLDFSKIESIDEALTVDHNY